MFKVIKQELLFIPLMLIILEAFRALIFKFYPETAMFDRGSELESFLFHVWQVSWISAASWILLRIIAPGAHRALVRFYNNFEGRPELYKQEFGIKAFLTVFAALILLSSGKASNPIRNTLYDTLSAQLHVRELTGRNDGAEVEKYLRFVNRQRGDAWCAAFTSYNLNAIGITKPINPVSAWAPAFANSKYIIWSQALNKSHKGTKPRPGDCFTLFYPQMGRVGHVGFIVGETGNYFITIEGNTGLAGSREGSGVHKLKRSKNKVFTISDYITPYLETHEKTVYHIPYPSDFLLSKEGYRIAYLVNGSDTGQHAQTHRFNLDTTGHLTCFAGQYKDSGTSNSGRQWPGEPAGDSNHLATLESIRLNYKWEAKSKLLLYRIGTHCSKTEPAIARAAYANKRFATKQKHRKDKGSSRNPEMG